MKWRWVDDEYLNGYDIDTICARDKAHCMADEIQVTEIQVSTAISVNSVNSVSYCCHGMVVRELHQVSAAKIGLRKT